MADRRPRGPVEPHRTDHRDGQSDRRDRTSLGRSRTASCTIPVRELLADPGSDDGLKLAAVAALLTVCRLLVVFDDFEQNLTSGGHGFLDPVIDDVITDLADAAQTGALLITSRYPLPGPDRFLADVL